MATFKVDKPAALADFLTEQVAIQAWRVPLLVQHGAVTVTRGGKPVTPLASSTKLVLRDVVAVANPLPASYLAALGKLPASAFWDFAFVPGTDTHSGYARQFHANRPRSKVITGFGPIDNTLESFIDALGRSTDVDHPVAYPIVVSHANEEGQLLMAMNLLAAKVIEYEELEAAVGSGRLRLDPALLQPRPQSGGQPAPAQLRVRGCRIGNAPPFLRKLKDALGGAIQVNAPKHFQYYGDITSTGGGGLNGVYEQMSYDFTVSRPDPVASRAALVKAFKKAGFKWIDKKPVPAGTWSALMSLPGMPKSIHDSSHPHTLGYRVVVRAAGKKVVLSDMAEYRYAREPLFTGWGAFPLATDPVTDRRKLAAVQKELSKQPLYQNSHPYPKWARTGFSSLDAFMAGWHWTMQYDKSAGQLRYKAERSKYTFVVPITRPGSKELIMNFYGTAGSPAVEDLHAEDPDYYATV
jgi:hypothetical protein